MGEQMEFLKLNHSDLVVSRVCMGGCPMGRHGWGEVLEQELITAVHSALDVGVNFFDNADTYGLGASEITLGKALKGRRDKAVIATKFGVRAGSGKTFYDNSPQWIVESCENSLRRLDTDYIDLYQIHYLDGVTPMEQVVHTLKTLRQQGKIRYFGLSNVGEKELEMLSPYSGEFVSCQNEYSLACRKHEADMLALNRELGVTNLTWGSLGQGVLSGKYGADAAFGGNDRRSREIYVNFHGEKLQKNLQIVEAMKPIAAERGKSLAAVAVRFILDYIPGSVALCGAKRPSQILGSASSLGWHLTEEELTVLERVSRQ